MIRILDEYITDHNDLNESLIVIRVSTPMIQFISELLNEYGMVTVNPKENSIKIRQYTNFGITLHFYYEEYRDYNDEEFETFILNKLKQYVKANR